MLYEKHILKNIWEDALKDVFRDSSFPYLQNWVPRPNSEEYREEQNTKVVALHKTFLTLPRESQIDFRIKSYCKNTVMLFFSLSTFVYLYLPFSYLGYIVEEGRILWMIDAPL